MEYFMKFLILIPTHLIAGRLFSVPLGVALFGKWYEVLIIIVIMDLIQIPFYFYIYESHNRVRFIKVRLRLIRRKLMHIERRVELKEIRNVNARLLRKARSLGEWGVLLVPSLPFLGGGLWSGVLLAHLLKVEKKKSYLLLTCGSMIGCTFLVLGFGGVKALLIALINVIRSWMI